MKARRFDALIRAGLRRLGWRVPLLDSLMAEPDLRFARRVVDPGWMPATGVSVAEGFNPFTGSLLVSSESALARWSACADPARDARDFNESDALVRQVLTILHDYLHAWAYARIRELLPRSAAFLRVPVREKDIEHHAFCHLVSEAAATVGLDYWYLSEVELDDVLRMGTRLRGLTVSYRAADAAEHDLHHGPGPLAVRTRRHFERIALFYCTGVFPGFDAHDLARSPRLSHWLTHELTYGEKQRRYTRQWLAYLATGRRPVEAGSERPLACSSPWQRALIRDVGVALEALVREGRSDRLGRREYEPRSRPIAEVDLRFTNLRDAGSVERAAADPWIAREQFQWLAAHRASRFRHPGDGSASAVAFEAVVASRSPLLLERFLAAETELQSGGFSDEPEDVFMIA